MSGLLKAILMIASGGAAKLEVRKIANIFGIGHVCSSVPFKELIVTLTSLATLSISDIRLAASLSAAVINLCTLNKEVLTPTPASTYSLSTAVT